MVQVYPNFFGDFQVISLWTAEQLSKQYRVFTRRADVYYKANSDGTFEIINL